MRRTTFAASTARRLLFIGLVPLVFVGIVVSLQLGRVQREAVGYRNSLLAESVRAEVGAFLETPAIALMQYTHFDEDPRGRDRLGRSLTEHLGAIESIVFVDTSGTVVAAKIKPGIDAHEADFVGLDRSGDPLFVEAVRSGTPVWSGVFTSMITGKRVLGLAVPGEGGVAMATIGIESLARTVRGRAGDPSMQVVIADRTGNVLFHSDEELAELRPNWANIAPVKAALEGREANSRYDYQGVEMLGSTALIGGADWVVLVQQEWGDARQPVMRVFWGIAFVVAVVALAAVIVAGLSSRALSQPLMELAATAQRIAGGDYDFSPKHYKHRELEVLANSIRNMAEAVRDRETALGRSNQELEAANQQLAAAVEDQERAMGKLGALSAELALTEERERRRLAEELHDGVSQSLAVVQMRLSMAAASGDLDVENARKIQTLLTNAIRETRALTSELASPVLYEIGLGAALGELAERVEQTHGLHVDVQVETTEDGLSDEVKMVILRAARELVMNIVKHARTNRAWIVLSGDDATVSLSVKDDGVGFDASEGIPESDGGFGLFSIRERLPFIGGTISVEAAPGDGTCVEITVART